MVPASQEETKSNGGSTSDIINRIEQNLGSNQQPPYPSMATVSASKQIDEASGESDENRNSDDKSINQNNQPTYSVYP